MRGIARELAADYALPLIEPGDEVTTSNTSIEIPTISIEDHDDCPLYTACRIEGVRVDVSPDWLQTRLIAAGLRPINGVVDVLNYTMLGLGQPMHAFDADTLKGDIEVRLANEGESFIALDGKEVLLQSDDLVVADEEQAIALAGIMGSASTGVTEKTRNIILESAAFKPAKISTTRRTCGLVSDSSMRFERGIDPAMITVAMNQTVQMIVGLFGGQVSLSIAVGNADHLIQDTQIKVSMQRIESRLGIDVPKAADAVLERMGFGIEHDGDALLFSVPSHRPDVRLAEDISEEYARVIGFDNIPAVMPSLLAIAPRPEHKAVKDAVAMGFVQVVNYAFISAGDQRLFVADDGQDLILDNPISEAMSVMRRSMFPGLINTAKYNMNRQQTGVALVEHGRVYDGPMGKRREVNMLAWLMTGNVHDDIWHEKARKADFYDIKGAVEAWLNARSLTARFIANDDVLGLQAGQTANIFIGKSVVGLVGKVDVDITTGLDLNDGVFVASINLDQLNAGKKAKFQPIPEFPSVERDLVFLFDKSAASDDILQVVRKACGQQLVDAKIFDKYDGKGVPEGKVSLGIRFVLQDANRTLIQEDSDKAMKAIQDGIANTFGAELRG